MSPKHILLLGGHGAIAQLLTPKLLSKSYTLTSLIRSESQKPTILSLGNGLPGKLSVDITSLSSITSISAASTVLSRINPDWIIWSAGAGGKGGPEATNAIDRDACIFFIRAAAANPKITKFLLVSYIGSRRSKAGWWDDEGWADVVKFNEEIAPTYYKAKLEADEVLTVVGQHRKGWGWIDLRPGALTSEKETGKVSFGKTKARGSVTRGDVAEVAAQLIEKEGVSGWFDLLGGEEKVSDAVERVLSYKVNCVQGEDFEVMRETAGKHNVWG